MKKLIALLLALVMVVSVLAACNTEKPVETKPNTDKPNETKPVETKPNETEPAGEQITLRLAHWGLGTEEEYNLERQMIDLYMELNPNV